MIRDATLDDAADVAALLGDLGYPTDAASVRKRLAPLLSRSDYAVRLLVDGDAVAGMVVLGIRPTLHEDTPVVEVTALVVRGNARRRGTGRALLAEADAFARTHGAMRITLTSRADRTEAHAFYAACEYERTGVRFTRRLSG